MSNFTLPNALQKIVRQQDLTTDEMHSVMQIILQGDVSPAQLAAFLMGMRMKGETVTELVAAAQVLRQLAIPVSITGKHIIDIVGTGGDEAHTFNISTTSAFVIAAAGGQVAKHGNRSISSSSGSADVLEAAGIALTLTPTQISQCISQLGIGFMFAPHHHTALKQALSVRKELGLRTFFNLIGPLTNPANAENQLIGVFSKEWVIPIAEVLQQLGSKHVLVVHSDDGLDEISINAATFVAELKAGEIKTYQLTPEQFGFTRAPLSTLKVTNVDESLSILKQVLQNQAGPARDIVLLNSGAAIYLAGLADDLASGIHKARLAIESGSAWDKFQQLISLSNTFIRT